MERMEKEEKNGEGAARQITQVAKRNKKKVGSYS